LPGLAPGPAVRIFMPAQSRFYTGFIRSRQQLPSGCGQARPVRPVRPADLRRPGFNPGKAAVFGAGAPWIWSGRYSAPVGRQGRPAPSTATTYDNLKPITADRSQSGADHQISWPARRHRSRLRNAKIAGHELKPMASRGAIPFFVFRPRSPVADHRHPGYVNPRKWGGGTILGVSWTAQLGRRQLKTPNSAETA